MLDFKDDVPINVFVVYGATARELSCVITSQLFPTDPAINICILYLSHNEELTSHIRCHHNSSIAIIVEIFKRINTCIVMSLIQPIQ